MKTNRFDLIAFDADDTLWHNEILYNRAQERFKELLSGYHSREWIEARLYDTEIRNLKHFGYGIKAFMLSMIETAIELTEGRVQAREIQQIIEFGQEMLRAEVQLLENVHTTIQALAQFYPLMMITKGDLLDQEAKIAHSQLADYFQYIEVVSDKNRARYEKILRRHGVPAKRFLMVGNSLRSDILPVLELGGTAVYIPYPLTWAHEQDVALDLQAPGFYQLEHIGLLPELIARLSEPGM
jgi:putative hydrolase of the HAD superfamily